MLLYRSFFTIVLTFFLSTMSFAQGPSHALSVSSPVKANSRTANVAGETAKINLNKASVKELMKVKGLNLSKARALAAYRKKQGEYKTLAELTNVRGFKRMKAAELTVIQEQLTIN